MTTAPPASRFVLLSVLVAAACAAAPTSPGFTGTGTASTTDPSAPGAGRTTGTGGGRGDGIGFGGSGLTVGAGGAGYGSGAGGTCAAAPYQAMQLPLDMYILQDQSGSMNATVSEGGTKWQAVTAALTTFVAQPESAGISVGLQYFGLPRLGPVACATTCVDDADCGTASCGPCAGGFCLGGVNALDSCSAADYATPEVEIAPLPGVASAIVGSLAQHSPATATPTGPALQGAVDHAKAWAATHPGHVVIAVLATDGEPDECPPATQAAIAQIAATALAGTPSIKTFAIGTFAEGDIPSGPDLLDAVAAAGGTGKAFDIDTTMNVDQAFLAALNTIRGAALGCEYAIPVPAMGTPDFTKLNVQLTPGGGTAVEIPHVTDAAHCPASGDAWYYDDDAAPKHIELCSATCTEVSGDPDAKIEILLGCQTKQAT